jgi:ABC-type branched-subunit amino acid transport system substrate-binding protein
MMSSNRVPSSVRRLTYAAFVALIATGCGSSGHAGGSSAPSTTASSLGSVGSSASDAPGVTQSSILIGAYTLKNALALQQQLGAAGVDPGNTQAQVHAVVDNINGHGGVGGRTLDLIVHAQNVLNPDISAEDQAACTDFTQDHHVFAVFAFGGYHADFANCLAAHHTILISPLVFGGQSYFETNSPYLYAPGWMNLDRLANAYVDGLSRYGFFSSSAKVGLVLSASPEYTQSYDSTLKPALAAKGITVVKVVQDPVDDTTSANQAPAAVLALKSAGVKSLLFWGDAGHVDPYLMGAAQEKYFPRYGFNSYDYPNALEVLGPTSELANAVSVGFSPIFDVDRQHDAAALAPEKACLSLMNQSGIALDDRLADSAAVSWCDDADFLVAVLGKISGSTINATTFQAAAQSLGTSYASPMTFSTNFGPNRWDGASSTREVVFHEACRCWEYSGPLSPPP